MYDELLTKDETLYVENKEDFYILKSKKTIYSCKKITHDSDSAEKLSKDDIRMELNKFNFS